MILKSIKLKNFRQYIDEQIEFSIDKDKNVTLVRGENNAGKTTLANALTWCFFGKLDKETSKGPLINTLVWENAKVNSIEQVQVEVILLYSDREYKITATQDFVMMQGISANSKKRPQPKGQIVRKITYKDEDGIKQEVPPNNIVEVIHKIIPGALSDYFFIRGEQMKIMEENTDNGSKFKEAVNKILGFEALSETIPHINSAIAVLKAKISKDIDEKMGGLSKTIETNTSLIDSKQNTIDEYKEDIKEHEKEIKDMEERIKEGEQGEQDQKDLIKAESDKKHYESLLQKEIFAFFSNFSTYFVSNCYQSLIDKVLEKLQDAELTDYDIPDVTDKTINWLLEHGRCLCGQKLEEGSEEYEKVKDWIRKVPPELLGNAVALFTSTAKTRKENVIKLQVEYGNLCKNRNDYDLEIDKFKRQIKILKSKLESYESTAEYQRRKESAEKDKREKENTISRYEREIKDLKEERRNVQVEYEKLAGKDKINAIILRRQRVLERINKHLQKINMIERQKSNELLKQRVNDFFATVFSSAYNIDISPDYKVKMVDNDGEAVGTGGAQGVTLVLAFIVSLLRLAHDIHQEELIKKGETVLSAEPYPLVLDAPFSNFDEGKMLEAAPKIANLTGQVIIFSKDPECRIIMDGDIKHKIGKFYELKPNELVNEEDKDRKCSTHIEGGNGVI